MCGQIGGVAERGGLEPTAAEWFNDKKSTPLYTWPQHQNTNIEILAPKFDHKRYTHFFGFSMSGTHHADNACPTAHINNHLKNNEHSQLKMLTRKQKVLPDA